MIRRLLGLAPILACAAAVLPGCETFQHGLRPRSQSDATEAMATDTKADEPGEPGATKGFFKSSRLSGAMSSEGRDIERSLGIH